MLSLSPLIVRSISAFIPIKKYRHLLREFLLHNNISYFNGKRLRTFYGLDNFGDVLSPVLIEYFGGSCTRASISFADFCCIGSLLDGTIKGDECIPTERPLHIFGTGFIQESHGGEEKFQRPVHIHALRGKLSKSRCEKILGRPLSEVALGDPGLLIRRMFLQERVSMQKDVGIVCHYIDEKSPSLRNIKLKKQSYRMISVREQPEEFVKQVRECAFILSSSLHGLICADSLGIPNKHMVLSDKVAGDGYKFRDYYSVFNSASYCPVDLRMTEIHDEDIEKFKEEYTITEQEVEVVCDSLVQAFSRFQASFPLPGSW